MADASGPLVLVGGGRMGEALLNGLLSAGWPAGDLMVVEKDPARREAMPPEVATLGTVEEVPTGPAGVVLAVKPADVEPVCAALSRAGAARVLSIAAGVTIASLEGWLGGRTAVLRAMPNTPALVGAGASALSAGSTAGAEDVSWARAVLESVGTVVELPEPALDAVTGLSGSGPAYIFLVAEALIDAGVLVGLGRDVAKALAVQTLLGSARLLAETGQEPAELRAGVTSPGGTTAAGLRALEAAGLRAAMLDAVAAATKRARELGRASGVV
jgi:pyrroline-5-carboxylate reductase